MKPASILCLLAVAGMAPAQGITLLEGPTAANLTVRVLDEQNPTAPGQILLQNAEVMPLEITGRTVAQGYETDRTRRTERNGFVRAELPGGGRLFQFRRQGGMSWGFLLVPADGRARVALEQPGIGIAGIGSPFADRIGIAADGRHAVVPDWNATWVVKLDGSTFPSTGTPVRSVNIFGLAATSVMVGPAFAFFQTTDARLWRCPLADGGVPVERTPPAVPLALLKDEMGISGDGTSVAFLYGPRDRQTIWLLRETGGPVQLPPPPSKYEEPDYLPEGSGHSHLLLNDDATRLLYVDASVGDELFLLDVPGAAPPLQVTADPIFQPYIGVHILPKFIGTTLYVAIGDTDLMDWFRTDTAGPVTNLTATGSATPPFPAGTLNPTATLQAGSHLLTTEIAGPGLQRLRRLDLLTGTATVLANDLTAEPLPGSAFAGRADVVMRGQGGDHLFLGATGQELAATPAGLMLTAPNRGPQYSATWVHLSSGWGLMALFLPDGTALGGPLEQGVTQLVMTAAGGCFVNGTPLRYLAPGIFRVLNLPAANLRVCVSGAGG